MGIPDVIWLYLICIAVSIVTAAVTSIIRTFNIGRRCRRVELRLGDIEARMLSQQGKKAAQARWDPETWIREGKDVPVEAGPFRKKREYDNDPLTE